MYGAPASRPDGGSGGGDCGGGGVAGPVQHSRHEDGGSGGGGGGGGGCGRGSSNAPSPRWAKRKAEMTPEQHKAESLRSAQQRGTMSTKERKTARRAPCCTIVYSYFNYISWTSSHTDTGSFPAQRSPTQCKIKQPICHGITSFVTTHFVD